MIDFLKKEVHAQVAIGLFILLTIWWMFLNSLGIREQLHNYVFGAVYGLMAAWGGFWGLRIAQKWGGMRSLMGKAIFMLSFGLLAQELGQLVFSYYNIVLRVPVPYPSYADIGFFGNIPFYIVGILYIAKVAGVQFTLKKLSSKVLVVLLPAVMLGLSYSVFLLGYTFSDEDYIKTFLDFGYPLGQAVYISIALLTYTLSKSMLGGIMRSKILLILIAFLAQYVAEYNFLFQSSRGTWYNAGYGDYLYLIAYLLMTLGILQLGSVATKLKHS